MLTIGEQAYYPIDCYAGEESCRYMITEMIWNQYETSFKYIES